MMAKSLWCVGSQEIVSRKWQKGTTKEMQVKTLDNGSRWNKTKDAEHEKAKEKKDEEDIEMKQECTAARKAEGPASDQPQAKMIKTDNNARKYGITIANILEEKFKEIVDTVHSQ